MKLKWQISIIAFLSLSFPLVVWFAFNALNQTYQENMLAAAEKQAQVILNSVEQYHQDRNQDLQGWVLAEFNQAPKIDGQVNEWEPITWYRINHRLRFKIASHGSQLYILADIQDNSNFIDLNQPSDRIILALGATRGIKKIGIDRQAEGPVFNQLSEGEYQAFWHEMASGYQVEIAINNNDYQRFGIAAVNHATAESFVSFGTLKNQQIQLTPFFQTKANWQKFLSQITPDDGQLSIKDQQGRVLYLTNRHDAKQPSIDWLTELIYELAFDDDQNDGSHFFGQRVEKSFSAGNIALSIHHTSAQLALIQTFIRSVFWIFVIALTLLIGYFLYALILAWRIKRLNKTLQTVMDDRGKINTALPSGQAKDEIGDLSRGMSTLLSQINEYTEYLKQLGSRLSHEMKTPISIVHTSLEILHMEQPDNEFVERALNANNRLKFILNQLSALSKLKQSIAETEVETFEINAFIEELHKGYQLTSNQITFKPCDNKIKMHGSKELMAQALDKLVQNALDFIGSDDIITISTNQLTKNNQYAIKVTNTGSHINENHLPQLFDSLSSFRKQKSAQPHLGLGLHIAKLICEFHQAALTAKNLKKTTAVEFSIIGPLAQ